ncbi:MAG TPA: YetF domain-containing protein [Gemmatimonadaceae bacterium]|nr:YetF domain-containing protein [Gemmatimonadaceae bacterium]
MDSVFRGLAVYAFLFLIFRIAGKRTLNQITTFDFVLLLIISESIQQAMIDSDNSVTNAFLLVVTLVGLDVALSLVKRRFPRLSKMLDSTPVVVIEDGHLHRDRMDKERIDESDILSAAREHQGLERLEQIKYAVVEQSGRITVVPKQQD